MNLIHVQEFNFFTLVTKLVPGGRICFERTCYWHSISKQNYLHHNLLFSFQTLLEAQRNTISKEALQWEIFLSKGTHAQRSVSKTSVYNRMYTTTAHYFNPLKPNGYYMYHLPYRTKILRSTHEVNFYVCVLIEITLLPKWNVARGKLMPSSPFRNIRCTVSHE
jgi:hypothetical protein